MMIDLGLERAEPGDIGSRSWPARLRRFWQVRRRWRPAVVALAVLAATGVAEPTYASVIGVLPDGIRYELVVPAGTEVGEVEGVSTLPMFWADGPTDGLHVGRSWFNFSMWGEREGLPLDRTTVSRGDLYARVFAPAGTWAMLIELSDHSLERRAEFELIEGREQDGLPVFDLPPSLRWAGPGDSYKGGMEVTYGSFRIVSGCAKSGKCSPDGQIMVVATGEGSDTDPDAGLSHIRIRVID
jgi:hypothetical protein